MACRARRGAVEKHRFDLLVSLYAVPRHAHGTPRDQPGHAAAARDVLLCKGKKEERGNGAGRGADPISVKRQTSEAPRTANFRSLEIRGRRIMLWLFVVLFMRHVNLISSSSYVTTYGIYRLTIIFSAFVNIICK